MSRLTLSLQNATGREFQKCTSNSGKNNFYYTVTVTVNYRSTAWSKKARPAHVFCWYLWNALTKLIIFGPHEQQFAANFMYLKCTTMGGTTYIRMHDFIVLTARMAMLSVVLEDFGWQLPVSGTISKNKHQFFGWVGQGRFWTIPSSDAVSYTTFQVTVFLWQHCLLRYNSELFHHKRYFKNHKIQICS